MTATITPTEWLSYIQRDYLATFIAEGGSSVKFAVPMEPTARESLVPGLQTIAESLGYLYVSADAAVVRVHMIDALFFGISWQVPWSQLCRRVVSDLAMGKGYAVPSATPTEPLADAIARENGLDTDWIRNELRTELVQKVFRDASLVRDFRVAMTRLCMAELTGGPEGETTTQVITEWLTGVNTRVAAVRPYGIQGRIHRTNARYFMESTLNWIRRGGRQGTVILLNTETVTNPKRSPELATFYTKAGVMDAYEVLRQFIDDMDNLEGCLMVVMPSIDFLEVDMPTRGMGCYEALKFRVYDEIRDRDLVNPMASLVRLDGASQ
jgi:hypothetical protein